jgi:hypothetical protein
MIRPDASWTPVIGANQCVPEHWNPTNAQVDAWTGAAVRAQDAAQPTRNQYVSQYVNEYVFSKTGAIVALWGLSIVASAIHGYKRHNGSVAAAVGWGVLGGVAPVITPVVALAEGYGKPLPTTANKPRSRRHSRR